MRERSKSKIFGLHNWKDEVDLDQERKDFGKIGSSVLDVVSLRCLDIKLKEQNRLVSIQFWTLEERSELATYSS